MLVMEERGENMKKFVILTAFLLVVSMITLPALAKKTEPTSTGNGAISGAHYNLNLIGMAKEKTAEVLENGNRIFVRLEGKTRILLQEGDFDVIDADGTDGEATFQLPNPGDVVAADGETYVSENAEYLVFIRALGKPGGEATMVTGVIVDESGQEWISTEVVSLSRGHGKSSFEDVTKELTTAYVDTDDDGVPDKRIAIFDDAYEGYFWDYDNNGLKIVQLRFYPVTN